VAEDKLVVIPGYWFMYNLYALTRNAKKYMDRDRRTEKIQHIEYDFLAPDTINEMFAALPVLEKLKVNKEGTATVGGWENSKRETELLKVPQAIKLFREVIRFYGTMELIRHCRNNSFRNFDELKKSLSARIQRSEWLNIGGQLIRKSEVENLKRNIKSGKIRSWEEIHLVYRHQGQQYPADRLTHGYTALLEILNITPKQFTPQLFKQLLKQALETQEWICKGIFDSRAKDYSNPFRKMVYETPEEMNRVIGRLEDNTFIQDQLKELDELRKSVRSIVRRIK